MSQEKKAPFAQFSLLSLIRGAEAQAAEAIAANARAALGEERANLGAQSLQEALAREAQMRDGALRLLESKRAEREAAVASFSEEAATESQRRAQSLGTMARAFHEGEAPKSADVALAEKLGRQIRIMEAMVGDGRVARASAFAAALGGLESEKREAALDWLGALREASRSPQAARALAQIAFVDLGDGFALRPALGVAAVAETVPGGSGKAPRMGRASGVLASLGEATEVARKENARWGFAPQVGAESGDFESDLPLFDSIEGDRRAREDAPYFISAAEAGMGLGDEEEGEEKDDGEWSAAEKTALTTAAERATRAAAGLDAFRWAAWQQTLVELSRTGGTLPAEPRAASEYWEQKDQTALWAGARGREAWVAGLAERGHDFGAPLLEFTMSLDGLGSRDRLVIAEKIRLPGTGKSGAENPQGGADPEALAQLGEERAKREKEREERRKAEGRAGAPSKLLSWAVDWESLAAGEEPPSFAMAERTEEMPEALRAAMRPTRGVAGGERRTAIWRTALASSILGGGAEPTPKDREEAIALAAAHAAAGDAMAAQSATRAAAVDRATQALLALGERGATQKSQGASALGKKEAREAAAAAARAAAMEVQRGWAQRELGETARAAKNLFGDAPSGREMAHCARNPAILSEAIGSCGAPGRLAARWGMWLGIDPAAANSGNHLCAAAREAWIAKGGSSASWKLLASMPEALLARLDAAARAASERSERGVSGEKGKADGHLRVAMAALGAAAQFGVDAPTAARWVAASLPPKGPDAPQASRWQDLALASHETALGAVAPGRSKDETVSFFMDMDAFFNTDRDEQDADWSWETREGEAKTRRLAAVSKAMEAIGLPRPFEAAIDEAPGEANAPADARAEAQAAQERANALRAIERDEPHRASRAAHALSSLFERAGKIGALDAGRGRWEGAAAGRDWVPRGEDDIEALRAEEDAQKRETPDAAKEAERQAAEAQERQREEEQAREWREIDRFKTELGEVADWIGRSEPGLWETLPAKPQWPLLARRAREWHELVEAQENAEQDAKQWDPLLGEQADGELKAVELTSGRELREEGRTMHHCVSTYAGDCHKGECRIFSIQKNGERHSTLELRFKESTGAWSAGQNLGVCNSPAIDPKAAELGHKLAAKATALKLKPTRPRAGEGLAQGAQTAAAEANDAQGQGAEDALGGENEAPAPRGFDQGYIDPHAMVLDLEGGGFMRPQAQGPGDAAGLTPDQLAARRVEQRLRDIMARARLADPGAEGGEPADPQAPRGPRA
jgi:hypothetical protein